MSDSTPIQPVIYPRDQHTVSREFLSDAAKKVLTILNENGHEAYIVGGGVRDLLLGRQPKDFDIVTDASPEQIKRQFRNCRLIGRRFRLAHVHMFGEIIEVSTFRANAAADAQDEDEAETDTQQDATVPDIHVPADPAADEHPEVPPPPSPEAAEENFSRRDRRRGPPPATFVAREDGLVLRDNVYGTPESDALRRDFTINALFYNLRTLSVIDFVGGMADIRARVIRSIGPASDRYTEDPVRMIRAVRIASQLGCSIEPESWQAILDRREHLAHANPHRLFEEVKKLLWCGAAGKVMEHLTATGLFGILFPELADHSAREIELAWLRRVTKQFDIWYKNDLKISTELMLALLFGKYHEQQANALMGEGMPAAQALDVATRDHLRRLMQRIMVPKFIAIHIGEIMAVQPRFLVTNDASLRLKHRQCFHDAFIYFKLASRFANANHAEVDWWQDNAKP